MTDSEAMRAYLHDIVEQLTELARREGFTQGAAYLSLAGMALCDGQGGELDLSQAEVDDDARRRA